MTNVYVIEAIGGPVKIGFSANPEKRLAALVTGTPFPLRLAHVFPIQDGVAAALVERGAHSLLASHRAHGEWFRVSVADAVKAVETAMQAALSGVALNKRRNSQALQPMQSRAARGLLDWTQTHLAERAGLSESLVRDFEKARRVPSSNSLAALSAALEAAGVVLVPEDQEGAGVRFLIEPESGIA